MDPNAEQSLLDRSCASALIRWATFYQNSGAWSNDAAYNAGRKFRGDLSRLQEAKLRQTSMFQRLTSYTINSVIFTWLKWPSND